MRQHRFRYRTYGLELESSLPLPELVGSVSTERPADITVEVGSVEPIPDGAVSVGPCQWFHGGDVWIEHKDIGRVLVTGGDTIVIDSPTVGEESILRLAILGNAIGVLLHQRGLFVLHAGAVAVDGAVVAFAGFSGAGKSTMTGAMASRGHALVADDVVAVDLTDPGRPTVYSGFPHVKLHPEAAEALSCSEESLIALHPELPKLGHRIEAGFSGDKLPLAAVYILEDSDNLRPEIVQLKAAQAVIELIRHSYAGKIAAQDSSAGYGSIHLQQCATLVRGTPISRLRRIRRLQDLPEVALLVERDIKSSLMENRQ